MDVIIIEPLIIKIKYFFISQALTSASSLLLVIPIYKKYIVKVIIGL